MGSERRVEVKVMGKRGCFGGLVWWRRGVVGDGRWNFFSWFLVNTRVC